MTVSYRERSTAARLMLTAVIGACAAALHWAMQPWIGPRIPFLFFLPALFIVASIAGRGPALLVLLTGFVNGMLLLASGGQPGEIATPDRISLAAYIVVGMLLVTLGGRMRLVNHRAADAERQLGFVFEDVGVGMFDIDLKKRTIIASPTMLSLLGRRPLAGTGPGGAIALDDWNAGVPQDKLAESHAMLKQQAAAGATHYVWEHSVTLDDGSERWLSSRTRIETDAGGRVTRMRGASADITERKRVEALLRRTQSELQQQVADLQHLHELSSRLLELRDLRGQLQAVLQALADFHGCERGLVSLYDARSGRLRTEASIGFSEGALLLLEHSETDRGACGLAYFGQRRVVVEDTETEPCFAAFKFFAREQGFRAVHSIPLVSSCGDVFGVISVHCAHSFRPGEREIRLADICARKAAVFVERDRARATAQESDLRFRTALESSAVPFCVLAPVRDAGGRIIDFRWNYANTAAAQLLHRTSDELDGQCVGELLPGSWDEEGLFDHYVAVAERGETHEFELHSKANGILGWFHVVASPLRGTVAVWYADVSERKRQEQALQEADRRKDEFLATLAHELRNPLAPIRQAALVSKAPGATDAQKRWSHDVIDRQVQHMALLLDDLLDVSRITRGTLQLRTAPTELVSVVDAAVETARPAIDARQHRLLIELPDQPVRFEADQLRIAQVLANLLTNAAKYTPAGGVIRLHAECSDDEICIAVIDNGIGIRADALSEIFLMFTQVHATQDRSNGGLGIGLALARGLVELHGGSISASSGGPGQGSRFTLRLPLRRSGTPAAAAEVIAVRSTPQRRILIADDNRDGADSLAEYLRLEGHEVKVVYDGEAAVAEFARFRPDVALLDIGMPWLSGIEVAQRVRAMPEGRAAMLVAVTGWGQDRDKSRTHDAGFDHHMTKPISLQRLAALLSLPAAASVHRARR